MKRVLVVEDHELNRELLMQLLGDSYEVRTAADGQEALVAVEAFHPDVILLDLSLPVLDGWSVAKKLKSHPGTKDIPIVALTAHAMSGDRERALKCGSTSISPNRSAKSNCSDCSRFSSIRRHPLDSHPSSL